MPRRPAQITQADIARALRAVEQVASGRMMIEIVGGVIRIAPVSMAPRLPEEPDREPDETLACGLDVVP